MSAGGEKTRLPTAIQRPEERHGHQHVERDGQTNQRDQQQRAAEEEIGEREAVVLIEDDKDEQE